MGRAVVYVDGMNLYQGIKASTAGSTWGKFKVKKFRCFTLWFSLQL